MKKNIVIIILAILVLCLGGYLVYDKVLSNDNDIIENNVEQEKEDSYDLIKVEELMNKYYFGYLSLGVKPIFDTGYTEDSMKYLSARDLNINSKVECSSIYVNPSNKFAVPSYLVQLDNGDSGFCYESAESISYETLSESYKKLFGNNKILSKDDFSFGGAVYDYNEQMDSFIKLTANVGGNVAAFNTYKIKNLNIIDNKLAVEVASVNFEIVSSPQNANEKYKFMAYLETENIVLEEKNIEEQFMQEFLNKNLENAKTYIFTFFEEDGVYKLESMVKAEN